MLKSKYSSGLMSQSFWFIEFKKMVKLKNDGFTTEEIKAKCLNENMYGAAKEYRAKRMYGYLSVRMNALTPDLVSLFCSSDLATQKLITLLAVVLTDRMFFEFMHEVYREHIILGNYELTDSNINIFFKNKQEQDASVAKWVETTFRRLKGSYTNFLAEAGLVSGKGKTKTITVPVIDIALERYLIDNKMKPVLMAMTGVE
jgi:hypothetical protein